MVDIVNGVGTIQINDTTPETVQLTLTDSQGTGLNVTSTQDVVFGIAPATKFVIIDPTDSIQGVAVTVTVQAQNQFGTVVPTYQNDVTLVASGNATGEGLVDIVNGIGTIQINDTTNETVQLTLSDTENTLLNVASTQDVVFGIAAATKFVIIDPADSVQGTAVTVTVQAQNQFGTIDTAYQNDVTLVASGNATGEGLVNIVNGVGTLQINDTTNETVQLTLTDSQSTGLNVTSTQDVVFGIAPATKFVIIDPADSVQGTAVTVTVQAQNNFGTIDTAYQNDVTLVTSGNATGGGVVNIVNGTGTKSINDNTAETVQLTLSDSQGTGLNVSSNQNVVFGIAPATKFVILNPTDTTVGSTVTVTVQAENNFGLIDPAYQNDVTLVTSGSATGGGLVNIVNGIGTKQITDAVAETVNLTLSDTQGTGLDVTSTQNVIFAVALIFQDTFNVGLFDNTLLNNHPPDIGLSWTQLINMNGSSGIKAYGIEDVAQPVSVVGFDMGSFYGANVSGGYAIANYEVEVRSIATGAATPIELGVRVSNTGNDGYFVRFNTTSSQLYKRVGGTWTAVGSAAGGVANNSIAKLQIIGTTLKFFINGTLTITATVTDISAAGVAGLGMGRLMVATDDETSIKADDFKVTLV
ncbi:MAG: beta strand repeat-containing protein [Bacteroidota bacterium]